VQNVVQELRGERIDIIPWTPDYATFISSSLAPAKISKVFIDEENRSIEVIVEDDQLSLAIGKRGQNVRLASKLTEWRIDIRSETDLEETFQGAVSAFMEKLEIGEVLARMLYNEGFASVEEIADVDLEELMEIEGLEEERARWIYDKAHETAGKGQEGGLEKIAGVGPKLLADLRTAGISTVAALAETPAERLTEIPGVGEKTAQKLLASAKALLEN
jgi:N utilization substance protein A